MILLESLLQQHLQISLQTCKAYQAELSNHDNFSLLRSFDIKHLYLSYADQESLTCNLLHFNVIRHLFTFLSKLRRGSYLN